MLAERVAQLRPIAGEQHLQGGDQQVRLAGCSGRRRLAQCCAACCPTFSLTPPSLAHSFTAVLPCRADRAAEGCASARLWLAAGALVCAACRSSAARTDGAGGTQRRRVHNILLLFRGCCLHCCPSAAYSLTLTCRITCCGCRSPCARAGTRSRWIRLPLLNLHKPTPVYLALTLHHYRTGTRSRWTQHGGGRSRRHARGRRWRGGGWHRSGWLLLLLRPPAAVAGVGGTDLHACCRADSGWICFLLAWGSFGLFGGRLC